MNRRAFFQTIAGAAVAVRHGDWAAFKRAIAGPSRYQQISPLVAAYYNKRALASLQKKFVFREMSIDGPIAAPTGKTLQWFRYITDSKPPIVTGKTDSWARYIGPA